MLKHRIDTDRLELIAATLELSTREISDREGFAAMLNVQAPERWPAPLNDDDSMEWVRSHLERDPEISGWVVWYFILRSAPEGVRRLIGNGGFSGRPDSDGTAEVGYSLLEEYQGKGYAGEALRGLLGWAFSHAEVRRVIAETLPELAPSIRLLQRNGFLLIGAGSEPGVIRFELTRAMYERAMDERRRQA